MTEHFSDLEIKARQMIEDYRSANEWSSQSQLVLQVFTAMWSASLPAENVTRIAVAMSDWDPMVNLQPALTKMVRRGLLRTRNVSRNGCRVRLYELAL